MSDPMTDALDTEVVCGAAEFAEGRPGCDTVLARLGDVGPALTAG